MKCLLKIALALLIALLLALPTLAFADGPAGGIDDVIEANSGPVSYRRLTGRMCPFPRRRC